MTSPAPAPAPAAAAPPAESISRAFVGTATWNLFGRGAFLVSGFVGTLILARSLPPDVYGLYALLIVLNSYAVVLCDMGLSNGVLRFAVQGGDAGERWQLFRFTLAVQCTLALFWMAVALLARPYLERAYRAEFGPFLLFVVVLALLTTIRNSLQNLRIASGRAAVIVAANLSFAAIWVGGLLLLTALGMTLGPVLLVQVLAVAAAAAWLASGLRPAVAPAERVFDAARAGMVTYSLAFVARGLITLVVQKQSEVFFLGHYLSMAAVGYYDVGYSFSFFALMSIHQALYPVAVATLTRAAEDGPSRLRRAVSVYYKVIFLHAVPIAAIGAVLGDRLVAALYGADMAPAGPIARAFFVVNLLPFLAGGVAVGMLAIGRPWAGMHLSVATAALNLGLDAFLIPRFGVQGAIAAVLTTGVVSGAAFLLLYRRYLGAGLVPWGYLGRCVLAALPIALLLPLRPWVQGALPLAAALVLGGALYLVGVRSCGLIREEERRMLDASGFPLVRKVGRLLGR